MANQVVWVDIPVVDLDRAIKFYSAVLGVPVTKADYPGMSIGLLPGTGEEVSGCLFVGEEIQPSVNGPLVYLNCDGRLDEAVGTVGAAGGEVVQPRHAIGPHGFRAIIADSEGNRLALHSR